MQKLLIVETDPHGEGYIISEDGITPYPYNDEIGDAGAVFRHLLENGIVSPNEVRVKSLSEVLRGYYNQIY